MSYATSTCRVCGNPLKVSDCTKSICDGCDTIGSWIPVDGSVFFPKEGEKLYDAVNNPSHYGQGSIEAIEYIRDFLTPEEYIGYLRGNIAKYLHRWRYKNGLEDLKKAQWYQNELIKFLEEHPEYAKSASDI